MPASYKIDKKHHTVICKAWGTLTDSDLLESRQRYENHPDFSSDMNQLFDFSDTERVELTSKGIRSLADRNPFGPGSKRAFTVEPGAMAMFGMARMFQILTDEHDDELMVQFNHEQSARSWLGLPEDA